MKREEYYGDPEHEHPLDRAEQEAFHERVRATLTEPVFRDLCRVIDKYYDEPSENGIETRSDQELVATICEAIKDDPEKLDVVIAYCHDEPNDVAGTQGLLQVLEKLSINLVQERRRKIREEEWGKES